MMLSPQDRLEAQRFDRERLLATFMASPDSAPFHRDRRSAWRPVLLGLLVALLLVGAAFYTAGSGLDL